jgi:serine/threonine protein kinase
MSNYCGPPSDCAPFVSQAYVTQSAALTIPIGGPLLGDRYKVLAPLGMGGCAGVYLARDEVRHEDVALKIAEAGPCDPETARLVLTNESRIYSRITNHQHVLQVHDLHYFPWRKSGILAMSMEYAKGGSFRHWLLQHKDDHHTRITQGLEYFKQMCLGASAVHQARAVHLDLKPDNFLFVGRVLKLSDFGAARLLQTIQLSSSMPSRFLVPRIGTPVYMAPEQFTAAHPDDLDERADIYALGCIAYEIFHPKCHPPFGGTENEVRERHLHLTPPPLVGVDANVARVVARCLEKI